MLPHTTPKHYITGITALNIPDPNGTYGDWHFHEAFHGKKDIAPKIFMAGESELLNTNTILEDFGIYECSDLLRQYGLPIPNNEKIYAANHYRAILDMLYQSVKNKSYPYHIDLSDWIDSPEQQSFLINAIRLMEPKLSEEEQQIIESWLTQQI